METKKTNKLLSATFDNTLAKVIEVEGSILNGLPSFSIVGLASSDIQEAKERAKSALINSNIQLPPKKIVINLSPSDIKKSGTHFDLAIALLIALNETILPQEDIFIFGELGLDGKVKSSSMIFPIILSLKEQNLISKALVPKEALTSLQYIKGVEFFGVESLNEAITILQNPNKKGVYAKNEINEAFLEIEGTKYFYKKEYPLDFKEVKGQAHAIKAALIAAAGWHNLLLNGSPGSGKSMIAKRLRYILPPLSQKEILTIAKYQYLNNQTPNFSALRPFRSPHHSATNAAIFGGGSHSAKIGEVALANKGILFFDELPHFTSKTLEALREPLQDKIINIARVNAKISYEADFIFVGAMNPCPCGNLLSQSKECRCTELEIKRYQNRLSDPLLDRIDLFVTMNEASLEEKNVTTSQKMHEMVLKAFIAQKKRGQNKLNGTLNEVEIEKYCLLNEEAKAILSKAQQNFALSFRKVANIKKVARTIADLNGNTKITKEDILEALSFRKR